MSSVYHKVTHAHKKVVCLFASSTNLYISLCVRYSAFSPRRTCGKFVPRPPLHSENNPRLWWIANQRVSGVFLHTYTHCRVEERGAERWVAWEFMTSSSARSTLWYHGNPTTHLVSLLLDQNISSIWPNTSSACAHAAWILISSRRTAAAAARRQGFTIPSEFHAFGDNPRALKYHLKPRWRQTLSNGV